MCLADPRTPIDREVLQYTPYQIQRLLVNPSNTYYWLTMDRNNIDFDRWVELDIKYIKERKHG